MKNYNPVAFTNDLQTTFEKTNQQNQNANELSINIINTFTTSIDALAPMEKILKRKAKNKQKPWLTQGTLHSIKIKRKWLKKFLKTKNSTHYKTYKLYRDKLSSLIRASKRNHYQHYFIQHNQNSKKTWNGINELLGKNRKTMKDNISLCINNEITSDQKQAADTLNKYFVGIGENLSANLSNVTHTIDYYWDNPNKENFYINPSTSEEVLELINELDANKSMDIYNISPKMMHDAKYFLSDALCSLFNKSVIDHCFPDNLKYAKVLPIHKGKSKLECGNYRPISLLPLFSKILERLMYNRLLSFITKHNILYQHQYGFQKSKSTELAVNTLLTDVIESLKNKKKSVCIFLDFAKAFDTVNHQILLKKLNHYGIKGIALKLFESYLANRKQCVSIGSVMSETDIIKCGVSQGSILGPLLFLIYINDITKSSNVLKFLLFADDTCLSFSYEKSNPETEQLLNEEMQKILDWLTTNKLALNVDKSNYLIFTTGKNMKFHLTLNNEILQEKDHKKYLGVIIDNNLEKSYYSNQITTIQRYRNIIQIKTSCLTISIEKSIFCICPVKY